MITVWSSDEVFKKSYTVVEMSLRIRPDSQTNHQNDASSPSGPWSQTTATPWCSVQTSGAACPPMTPRCPRGLWPSCRDATWSRPAAFTPPVSSSDPLPDQMRLTVCPPQCRAAGLAPLVHAAPPAAEHDSGLPGEPAGLGADAAVGPGVPLLAAHLRTLPRQRRSAARPRSSCLSRPGCSLDQRQINFIHLCKVLRLKLSCSSQLFSLKAASLMSRNSS